MKELIKIQSQLRAPKNLLNKFGNYNYRNTEGILEAVKPLLAENGCTLLISDDIQMLGDRFYIKATARIVNADGEFAEATAFAREAFEKKGMDDAQITGAASSYARKYALNGLFLIDDTKDADFYNDGEGKKTKKQAKETSQASSNKAVEAIVKISNAQNLEEIKAIWDTYKTFDTPDKPIALSVSKRRRELNI